MLQRAQNKILFYSVIGFAAIGILFAIVMYQEILPALAGHEFVKAAAIVGGFASAAAGLFLFVWSSLFAIRHIRGSVDPNRTFILKLLRVLFFLALLAAGWTAGMFLFGLTGRLFNLANG